MKRTILIAAILATLVPAGSGWAADLVRYVDKDGIVKTAMVEVVSKDDLENFSARVRIAGRKRTLRIPSNQVIEFWRGDSDSVNQWSKNLAKGRRLMGAKQYATVGTTAGAEEIFTKIAYSVEKGTPGQEKAEECYPWQNMYALFYLIQTRYLLGQEGKPEALKLALLDIEQFRKRSETRAGRKIEWKVPGAEGSTVTAKIHGWGETRLLPLVTLYEARIQAALGDKAAAVAVYEKLIDDAKKKQYAPALLATAIQEKTTVEADGQESEKAEALYRASGNVLKNLSGNAKDPFGKGILRRAANEAFLQGADLLFASAVASKVTYDVPLNRYTQLREGEGRRDPALYFGAQAGIGACMTEKGQGEMAYKVLLEVVTQGGDYPGQMAQALYYISRAAPLFADEIEKSGGKADFLRQEAPRWAADLKERYPTSEWAARLK